MCIKKCVQVSRITSQCMLLVKYTQTLMLVTITQLGYVLSWKNSLYDQWSLNPYKRYNVYTFVEISLFVELLPTLGSRREHWRHSYIYSCLCVASITERYRLNVRTYI